MIPSNIVPKKMRSNKTFPWGWWRPARVYLDQDGHLNRHGSIAKNILDFEYVSESMRNQTYHKGIDFPKHDALEATSVQGKLFLSHSVVLEQELLKQDTATHFVLQSQTTSDFQSLLPFVQTHFSKIAGALGDNETVTWLLDQIGHLDQLVHWYKKCTDKNDFLHLTLLAYKLFTGRTAGAVVVERFLVEDHNVQSDFGEMLRILRSGLTSAQNVVDAPIVKKLVGVYSYLMVQGFLTKFGMVLSDEDYSRMEQRALLSEFSSRKAMWLSVLDTTLFICERLYDFQQTGDFTVFLHSSSQYSEWLKSADRVLALAPFSSNLTPHGTTYFSYVADINDLVERGEAYAKYTRKTAGCDSSFLQRKLLSLQLLKNTEITRRASQKERRAPFGVLVYGCSSVAKSTFTKMLYYYYGKVHGLATEDHYRYVRNPADEYWSNFDSSKWCIQLDDIAFLLPNKSSDVDPTLKEMLNVVNNVPYVPPQAALEDKGKTPVMAKLVVATTNAKDLNAQEYFWCPLAVRRRLPFVVEIKPKKQYLHENQRFIDPAKLPVITDSFPDFWDITVQKIIPHFDGQRDRAELSTVAEFDNSADFLKFFGEASRAHEGVQDKSMVCDSEMGTLHVCPICLMVTSQCTCAIEVQANNEATLARVKRTCVRGLMSMLMFWVQLQWSINLLTWLARYKLCKRFVVSWFLPYFDGVRQMHILGTINSYQGTSRQWKSFLVALAAVASCAAVYFAVSKRDEREMEEQGNIHGSTEEQLEREERQNVWYQPNIELTTFDASVASQSLVGASGDEVERIFSRNCVRLDINSRTSTPFVCDTGAIFVRGHYCVANLHAFRSDIDDFDVTIIQSPTAVGLTPNITVRVQRKDLIQMPDKDFCLFEVRTLPPFKDITRFWAEQSIEISRGLVLRRQFNGGIERQEIFAIAKSERFPIEKLGISPTVYVGTGPRETRAGDCGAMLVATTPRGVVIMGMHTLGHKEKCGTLFVSVEDLTSMIEQHKQQFAAGVDIQGGGEAQLTIEGRKIPLVQPHCRSMFRYLEKGHLNVYGSFAGFRPRPKSRVCATPLRNEMCEHFKCSVGHDQPDMKGWLPWRKNVEEMVNPRAIHDKQRLADCVKHFTDDIIRELPQGWEKDLVFLSHRASVNGLPGVAFIDRINANTSMGFPWNKSKKGYLTHFADELYPDGVEFGDEVWDRVAVIEAAYARGERAFPIFTGHLKDEPTTLKKVADHKTRVFTGAPVDWSLVVRSRLLAFVRLVQKNKFVFEAGPGTVCQSDEWGRIHQYLTHFGADRIVAGDYSKYDKKMLSDFILAAFDVIVGVYKKAGFSDEELREILCIGEDIAFPLVNMGGDLVEFFGTNPSGHPLTVIVNSIVNSLYMRYCFATLSPDGHCGDFRKDVHLFTYGDDNIMGVSPLNSWFNHTAIQKELGDIGVGYTMADKEAESVPFVNIDDVSFLKRSWRFDEEVGAYLCPLEEASLHKSLTTWLPSRSIDEFAQMVAVISSANSEYFFYGREVFEKHHAFFRGVLAKEPYAHYVGETTLPNWEDLKARFWRASSEPPKPVRVLADPDSVN